MWWERPNICKLRLGCRPLKEVFKFSQWKSVLHPNVAELSFARCMGCRLPCLDFAWEKSILCTIRWFRSSISRWPRDCEIVWDCMHRVRSVAAKLSKFTSFCACSCHCRGYQQCQDQKFQGYGEYTAICKSSLTMFKLLVKLLATKPRTTTRAVPHTLINGRRAPYRALQHANACATREVTWRIHR